MSLWADDMTREAAAIREAAHIVVARVLGLAIGPKGISIDGQAWGFAHFQGADAGTEVAYGDVERVVIALLAGGAAHKRKKCDVKIETAGDEKRIAELFESHTNSTSRIAMRPTHGAKSVRKN